MTSCTSSLLQVNLNLEIPTLSLYCCRVRTRGYFLTFWSILVLSLKELQKRFNSIIIFEGQKKHYTVFSSCFERYLPMLQVSSEEAVEHGILKVLLVCLTIT